MPDPGPFILGAGSAGLGLSLALADRGVPLRGMWNRRETPNLREFSTRCLGPIFSGPLHEGDEGLKEAVRSSSPLILAVSDDAIEEVARALHTNDMLTPHTLLVHLSGCLTSEVLRGGFDPRSASFHPLAACPTPAATRATLPNAFFTLEGGELALPVLEGLVKSLGGKSKTIQAAQKKRYHASAVLASNLMVALLAVAGDEAAGIGLDDLEEPLARLAIGALERARESGTQRGLTGPLVRGDLATIAQHLEALSPAGEAAYRLLSHRALKLVPPTELSPGTRAELTTLLTGD